MNHQESDPTNALLPFEIPARGLHPFHKRGTVSLQDDGLEIEFWSEFRLFRPFKLPTTSIRVPLDAITGAEIKRRWLPFTSYRVRLLTKTAKTFRLLNRGLIELKIPADFRPAIRRFATELNLKAALRSINL